MRIHSFKQNEARLFDLVQIERVRSLEVERNFNEVFETGENSLQNVLFNFLKDKTQYKPLIVRFGDAKNATLKIKAVEHINFKELEMSLIIELDKEDFEHNFEIILKDNMTIETHLDYELGVILRDLNPYLKFILTDEEIYQENKEIYEVAKIAFEAISECERELRENNGVLK